MFCSVERLDLTVAAVLQFWAVYSELMITPELESGAQNNQEPPI